jgi:multidrug transporter EmrE-like cation transporter
MKGWQILVGTFISSVSQVMLKKSAGKNYGSRMKEYLNPLVITAYILFFAATLLSVLAYRSIGLSTGAILETSGYIYITIFGLIFFREKLTPRKLAALGLIISGTVIFTLG